jgi:hypothetical protein
MDNLSDEYLDLKGLSTYSKMGVSTLRYHIRVNDLPWFRITGKKDKTGKVLVRRSEFNNWMERFRGNECLDPDAIATDVINSLNSVKSEW